MSVRDSRLISAHSRRPAGSAGGGVMPLSMCNTTRAGGEHAPQAASAPGPASAGEAAAMSHAAGPLGQVLGQDVLLGDLGHVSLTGAGLAGASPYAGLGNGYGNVGTNNGQGNGGFGNGIGNIGSGVPPLSALLQVVRGLCERAQTTFIRG